MRSARTALVVATLALVLVPLAAMFLAFCYEWWLVSSYQARLSAIAAETRSRWPADDPALRELAEKHGVMLRIIGRDGTTDEVTPRSAGAEAFWVKGPFEGLSDLLTPPPPRENLAEAERTFGPVLEREESREALGGREAFAVHFSPSGETAALVLASPLPDGRILTVTKASHRGVRRLLSLRREMARMALYQAVTALVVGLLLGRWLVRPLTRLASSASRYGSSHGPGGEPLVSKDLLARRDEIGQLARSMAELTATLEARRKEAADRAAELAHELKNPLAAIAAAAEHLGTTRELSEEKRRMISEVSSGAAQRLLATTEAMLSLARLEAALPEQERVELDYRAFLEALLDGYRKDVRHQGFELRLGVAPEAARITVVKTAWEQLVRNLLDNALAQPAKEKLVEVEVSRTLGAVVTRVTDHGPGVPEGNRDKIFRRFFSDRPPGTPPGSGLGLSIVQAVAEAHSATVVLAPAEAGQGARFVVTLPVRA